MSNSPKNLANMLCLDIYLSSFSQEEQVKLSRKIKPMDYQLHPLLSGDIYSHYMHHITCEERKKADLQVLLQFQKKSNWNVDLETLLKNDYYALVLTDVKQIILWANKNFPVMTGYSIRHAVGQSPRFLQGEHTSDETRKRIKQQLDFRKPFTETVINYRKNKQEYHCQVTIYPLWNDKHQVTHFLALESETTA